MMRRQWLSRGLALILASAFAGGCAWLEDRTPEFVRVTLDSDAHSMVLITSTRFFATTDEQGDLGVEVFGADTTIVSFPFDQSWNIRDEQRFLLLGFPGDSSEVSVRVRVLIDEDLDFDNTVMIEVDDPVRYIYLFNQQVIQDFELL